VRPDVLPILPGPNVSSGSIAEVHGHVDRRQHAVERAVELSRRRRRPENLNFCFWSSCLLLMKRSISFFECNNW
jgi:hypothetical protein